MLGWVSSSLSFIPLHVLSLFRPIIYWAQMRLARFDATKTNTCPDIPIIV